MALTTITIAVTICDEATDARLMSEGISSADSWLMRIVVLNPMAW